MQSMGVAETARSVDATEPLRLGIFIVIEHISPRKVQSRGVRGTCAVSHSLFRMRLNSKHSTLRTTLQGPQYSVMYSHEDPLLLFKLIRRGRGWSGEERRGEERGVVS